MTNSTVRVSATPLSDTDKANTIRLDNKGLPISALSVSIALSLDQAIANQAVIASDQVHLEQLQAYATQSTVADLTPAEHNHSLFLNEQQDLGHTVSQPVNTRPRPDGACG